MSWIYVQCLQQESDTSVGGRVALLMKYVRFIVDFVENAFARHSSSKLGSALAGTTIPLYLTRLLAAPQQT